MSDEVPARLVPPRPENVLSNERSTREHRTMTVEEIEGLRRSAAMAPLSPVQVIAVLEECARMARERQQIAQALADLPESVAALRAALNRLHRIVQPG